jgi:hypothetical protein
MKILNKIWGVSLLALLLIVAAPHISKAQDESISEQDFYDELAPYGTWVSDPQYGDVWIPDVAEDFRPYQTQGHWVLTEYGNTWVSEYPWGWATFHYGRWRYDNYYGWEWIPGYEWAPAWVSWRHGGGYYGWAPLTPGISLSLSFGNSYSVPDSYWAFAPEAYINRPNIYNYYVPHTRVVNIIRNTTVINNTYSNGGRRYIAGPRAADIQRYTHQTPRVYSINNASRPGAMNVQNNTVSIFRPAVKRNGDARPQRVVDANAYKQQNPNQGIARRGPGGAAGFNHDNAARLANVARSANDNNNVVRVNNRPNNDQQGRRADQQGNRQPNQQGNGRPDGQGARPTQAQPAQTPPAQTQPGQQPTFNRGSGRSGNDNRPATTQPNNGLQQKQQQLNNEQRTLRDQRRQQYQREQQLQSVGQTQQAPAINGQTPLQQQQDAIRGQRRQLQQQQAQQQRAQQAQQVQQQAQQQQAQQQQAQREQQRQAAQQALQQQQAQQRGQAQQQADQQQRAQREQQRQAQQQQAQAQQQQQAQQREQQRQAQQAAQQQQQAQRQQQQQAAQQAQQQQRAQQQQAQQQQRQQQQQQPQRQQRRPPEPPVKPVN